MTSAISQSSVGTVIEDLVSDRSIPLKVCMIILNIAQLISCWIAVGYFIKYYEIWSLMELTLSLVILLSGNYLIPCIANAVIYGRRWKRSSVSNRRQIEEENKQAWVCLRIALSLCGIPTVGRYIETIIVSNKLRILEKKHIKESVVAHKEGSQLNPIGTSRIGSTVNQLKSGTIQRNNSVISGMSQASSTGIPESSQRKVRKARRQYKRCEHDGSLMALIAGSVGAGPMAIGLGFLYFQREEIHAMKPDQMVVVCASFSLNLLWLAATLTHFYPARHVLSEAEFERGIRPSHVVALLLLYLSHLVQVTLRVVCLVIFVSWFYGYVCIPIVFHWLLGTFLFVGYQAYMRSHTVGRPIGERVRKATTSFLSALFLGYVGIFDFVNGNIGKTRARYIVYYSFYYLENVTMLVIWILRNPITQIRYPIPFVCVVLGLFWLGFILFQIYLYYYSYSPYGSSLIGICKKHKSRRGMNYVEEVREPVFGMPLAQSAVPFWRLHQHGDHPGAGSRLSGVSGSKISQPRSTRPLVTLDQIKEPSILSSQSQNHTPSIFSPPSSQLNGVVDRGRHNPIMRPPPVIAQRLRQGSIKSLIIKDSSSSTDSSSMDDDELQVFSPRLVASRALSEPDMSRHTTDTGCRSVTSSVSQSVHSGPGQCHSSGGDAHMRHGGPDPCPRDTVKVPGVPHTRHGDPHMSPGDPLLSPWDSNTSGTGLTGQYKAAPAHYARTKTPGSIKSMADVPANGILMALPTSTTKRIGLVPPIATTALRPLPSRDQMKRLHQRRHSQSGGRRQ